MSWVTPVSTFLELMIKVFLLILLMFVGIVLVVGLVRLRSSTSNSITIASFTETGANTREEKSRGFGHDIADALEIEVLRIAQLHKLTNPWGSTKELPSLQMTGPQTVNRVGGSINLAGIELPVEVVVEILKPLLARPRTQYMITGNFQRFPSGDGTRAKVSENIEEKNDCLKFPSGDGTPVQIIIRLEAEGRMLKRWRCKSQLTTTIEHDAQI